MKANGLEVARCTVERLIGQIGSIKHDCIARLVMCHLLNLKSGIIIILICQVKLPDSSKSTSDIVGALHYIKTTSDWVYTAFIIDVFACAIVGWKVSNRMNTDMVMAALNQAIADRDKPKDVIHHSDRGVQYLSIRYTDKMANSGVIAQVGTTGDSYDNALAETVNGLYKSEVIHYLKQNWTGVNDVELATLEWVDWFNKTRLHSTIGYSVLNTKML